MTEKVLIEVFASLPPCSGGWLVKKRVKELEKRYGDRVEIKIYEGINEKVNEYGIETTPAIVIDEDIRIIGVAPSIETLENALKEAGL
jgi:protein-disulfide isomerase